MAILIIVILLQSAPAETPGCKVGKHVI